MPAEHDDDRASVLRRGGDGVHHAAKVPCHQYVRQRRDEPVKRSVLPRRRREFVGAHLVRPARDRNGSHLRQVRLSSVVLLRVRRTPAHCLTVGADADGRYVFRYRLNDPSLMCDFIWSITRRLSFESQTSARPFSENTPRALMIGRTTMASNVPAGTVIFSSRRTWM